MPSSKSRALNIYKKYFFKIKIPKKILSINSCRKGTAYIPYGKIIYWVELLFNNHHGLSRLPNVPGYKCKY